ncbi:2-oxoacid:ferredoxin oxidoreductase subunit gamma [Methanobrevibacter millerae]|uniref:2-oxoacid:ferredoxin oxidoreductase subunit gamma n=1 Tax=Methanobrevibacter millerae TaxID=230361 RepID=A0A8T3VL98_9EURY|nr:2-oxoacid:ferredoxin oxidoreductase subunit gamma [Methanobrevibacter millerae]MBE6505460.1 2-oxoacid:ferredoxin oxidoreductase subunit gamma [Methanobrevibacter millerae]MBR0370880.1 2-oxoacid:ferredoxin oxidoreductase subunit gamma [Methanobrevibacter sp.]
MRTEIRIGGFGGQGVILAGIIIGKAASIFDENEAVQTQSYGPEARGGASKCEVVVSDSEIDYPKVQSPDILVAMSNEALIKYIVDLKDEGTLIVDPGTTDIEDVRDFIDQHNIKVYEAPATKTANDEIGLKIVANIVMVGAITKITGVISENAAIEAIKDSVPAGTEEKNINAFEAGYNLV